MAERAELARVPAFRDLPDDQLDWFLSQCQENRLAPGEIFARSGDPADAMFVVLEGELQIRGEGPSRDGIVVSIRAGEVSGRLPFSRLTQYGGTIRAITPVRALSFPVAQFTEMFQRIPELVRPGEDGWLFPPGSVDALTRALEDCLSAPIAELQRMGDSAYARVLARHAIDTEAGHLATLFTQFHAAR